MKKWLVIFLITLVSGQHWSQAYEGVDDEMLDIFDMIDDDAYDFPEEEEDTFTGDSTVHYTGEKRSFIKWHLLDPHDWLSFDLWKIERSIKDKVPRWKRAQRELGIVESLGRVIDCVGRCRIYRGEGYANASYRSRIQEGDEIHTLADSYLWLYLYDGSLMRFAPNTTVTFKEINISVERFFYNIRLNSGNIIWLDRRHEKYSQKIARETDTLFFPLPLFDANGEVHRPEVDENDLYSFLDPRKTHLNQYKKLNDLVEENNFVTRNKKTTIFLVMPNGTLLGDNANFEAIVLLGGNSYVKRYKGESIGLEKDSNGTPLTFFFRGYENRDERELEKGQWYEIEKKGRSISNLDPSEAKKYGFGEFLVSRIPTILIARELLLKKYSLQYFNPRLTSKLLAKWHFRLWDAEESETKNEMKKRIAFLKEYTRREETTALLVSSQFKRKLEERGEKLASTVYDSTYYALAMDSFMRYGEKFDDVSSDRTILNSTKKVFWKYINALK